MAGVNEAYRIETGDEMQMNHESWDDSDNESQMQQKSSHRSAIITKTTKQEVPMGRRQEAGHKPQRTKGDKGGMGVTEMSYENHHFSTNQNFENCCLIQVAEGAFDDRLLISQQFYYAVFGEDLTALLRKGTHWLIDYLRSQHVGFLF